MAKRLKDKGSNDAGKKISPNAKYLPFPMITFPGVVQRAQRHVADSITTLRSICSRRFSSPTGSWRPV
jgi:hypothetical protein